MYHQIIYFILGLIQWEGIFFLTFGMEEYHYLIVVFSTYISTTIAIIYGSISGMAPEWIDDVMMKATEIFLSIPSILVIIFVQAIIGGSNPISISLVIGVVAG